MKETVIDSYLEEQQELTAVEHFSQQYDFRQFGEKQTQYTQLIPKTTPGPGQQYAFEVDLDKCTGCKACVTACHNENGLDENESWRSVGLIQGGGTQNPTIQHITSACHHCMEPACMKGCPTKAYEKDPLTGIVKHLDDQCFGCQYCLLTCPYDVPKYNKKRGIVHKCDMCISRLEVGQAPACVRACPTEAICISIVDKKEVKENFQDYVKIPDAPASNYTFPTTKYKTKRVFPTDMESVDYYTVQPEHSHLPLVLMLVLTQLSVGAFGAELFLRQWMNPRFFGEALYSFHAALALGIGLLALGASIFHLGRPLLAFRAVLGFKTSWLSREIIAFVLFAALAILYALSYWIDPIQRMFRGLFMGLEPSNILIFAIFVVGVLGISSSVMVYKVTKRPFWNNHWTTLKFFMTAFILGSSTMLLTSTIWGVLNSKTFLLYFMQYIGQGFCKGISIAIGIKLLLESGIFIHLKEKNLSFAKKTAMLMAGQLKRFTLWRFVCGILGGILMPLVLWQMYQQIGEIAAMILTFLIFGLLVTGEFLERYLFFRAVVPLRMPGGKFIERST